jgi:Domain of unknown function (DUF4116)
MSDTRPRLEKILDLYGKTLSEVVNLREPGHLQALNSSRAFVSKSLDSQEAQLNAKDLVLRFAGSDPTDGKTRTQWLVKTYIQDDQFKLEDLGRADAALAAFERFKRKLPVEQRELSRFKSLRELETLVDPFIKAEARARLERDLSSATGREKRRLEEWKARDESIIVQEAEGLPTIAVPMTEFASCWWGRGTKWCTAAEKNNMFETYHQDAPLIIIVCSDGAKFQAHVKKDDVQFMDNVDKSVNKETVRTRWNEFKPLLDWMLKQNGMTLQFVPEKHRTPELYHLAVEQNGLALQHVHKNKRTPELCRLAIEQDGRALQYVPQEHRTPELCRIAIEQNGRVLKDIPETQINHELCRLAVEQNGFALVYVPPQYKAEIFHFAVKQNGMALAHVSKELKTPKLCRIAVEQNGFALEYVPEDLKTPELCRIAVEQDGQVLRYVTKKTPELCRIAVQQAGEALGDAPEEHRTLELCGLAIQNNGWALYAVPKDQRTPKLCRLAVEQNGLALAHVFKELKTPALCQIAVEQNGLALQYIPKDKRTTELCRIAVEQNGLAFEFVPEEFKTHTLFSALAIPSSQPKWHPDILQGLSQQSQPLQDFKTQ